MLYELPNNIQSPIKFNVIAFQIIRVKTLMKILFLFQSHYKTILKFILR